MHEGTRAFPLFASGQGGWLLIFPQKNERRTHSKSLLRTHARKKSKYFPVSGPQSGPHTLRVDIYGSLCVLHLPLLGVITCIRRKLRYTEPERLYAGPPVLCFVSLASFLRSTLKRQGSFSLFSASSFCRGIKFSQGNINDDELLKKFKIINYQRLVCFGRDIIF